MMNRIRALAIVTVLMFTITAFAQQTTTSTGDAAKGGLATVGEQLKVLTERLDLTGDQQAKIKPILQHLHDVTEKLMADKSLSHEERLDKVRPVRYETDRKIRAVLNEDQKKKLDQYEQEPHPEMHGNLSETQVVTPNNASKLRGTGPVEGLYLSRRAVLNLMPIWKGLRSLS